LVEVIGSEQAHIESWLSKEIGVDFKVPNLSDAGWTFQGARLLVVAGKPVAQLMYTNAEGAVIALSGLQNRSGTTVEPALRAFGDVHMGTWKNTTGRLWVTRLTRSKHWQRPPHLSSNRFP